MTRSRRLGDRFSQDAAVRSVGLVALSDGKRVGLSTVTMPNPAQADEKGLVRPSRLIRAIPIPASERWTCPDGFKIAGLADLDNCLMESVHRFDPTFGRVQGVVTAIRGAVRVKGPDWYADIAGLLEVRFDETDLSGRPTPELQAADSGIAVTTWNGRVLGLLVGGERHMGFVCPVSDFLREQGLSLECLPNLPEPALTAGSAVASDIDDGHAAYRGDLRREPRLETAEWDLELA